MIGETNASLEAFLRSAVFGSAPMPISFDVPTKAWATALRGPSVNCFLYDVRENQPVKHTGTVNVRDQSGRVVGRRPVPRYMDHCYLVSAWAPDANIQFRMLSAILSAFLETDTLPRSSLQGALAAQPRHVVLSVAQGMKRGMLLSLGGDQKLALELELAVPWKSGPDEQVDHHVETVPRIEVVDRTAPRRRRTTIAIRSHQAPTPAEPAPPAPVGGPPAPPAESPADRPTAEGPPAPAAPEPVTPQTAGARMLAQVAARLLAQVQAPPPAEGPEPPPPLPRVAAQLGAQVGSRIAALVQSPGQPPDPQAPMTPLQQQAARAGAQVATRILEQLQQACQTARAPDAAPAPTPQAAAQLGARLGAQLAAQIVQAVSPVPAPTPEAETAPAP